MDPRPSSHARGSPRWQQTAALGDRPGASGAGAVAVTRTRVSIAVEGRGCSMLHSIFAFELRGRSHCFIFPAFSLSVGSGLALSMCHGVGAVLRSAGLEQSRCGPAEVSRVTAHVTPFVNRVSIASF